MLKCLCDVLPCDWLTSVHIGYVYEAYVKIVLMTTHYLFLVTFVGESRCQGAVTELVGVLNQVDTSYLTASSTDFTRRPFVERQLRQLEQLTLVFEKHFCVL
jgi:hypothetical protein